MGYGRTNRRLTYGADSPNLPELVSQLQGLMGFVEALEYISKYQSYQTKAYAAQVKIAALRKEKKEGAK